jgi:hypothetical protein
MPGPRKYPDELRERAVREVQTSARFGTGREDFSCPFSTVRAISSQRESARVQRTRLRALMQQPCRARLHRASPKRLS